MTQCDIRSCDLRIVSSTPWQSSCTVNASRFASCRHSLTFQQNTDCIWTVHRHHSQSSRPPSTCCYGITVVCSKFLEEQVFLPARRSKRGLCYGDVAGWLGGWVSVCLSVTAGNVSKRLNLALNFFDLLVAPSFKLLWPLAPIPNSKGNPFIGGVKYTGVGKLAIFDGYRSLSRKRYKIGR